MERCIHAAPLLAFLRVSRQVRRGRQPIARYVSVGPGDWTVDAVMPLIAPATGEGEIEVGTLPGGPAVVAIHMGPYEELHGTHATIERWIGEHGVRLATGGGPRRSVHR